MKRRWNVWGVVMWGVGLMGCASTVGDACTTDGDCGHQGFCINQGYTPGGYCSQACLSGNDATCPSGSTCVSTGATADTSACFLKCKTSSDCRKGYQCLGDFKGSATTVCVAPE